MVGEPVRSGVQVGIAVLDGGVAAVVDHCDRVRGGCCPAGEQLVGAAGHTFVSDLGPGRHQQRRFGRVEHRNRRQSRLCPIGDSGEQSLQVIDHPPHGGAVQQRRRVLQAARQRVAIPLDLQGQVESGYRRFADDRSHGDPG